MRKGVQAIEEWFVYSGQDGHKMGDPTQTEYLVNHLVHSHYTGTAGILEREFSRFFDLLRICPTQEPDSAPPSG